MFHGVFDSLADTAGYNVSAIGLTPPRSEIRKRADAQESRFVVGLTTEPGRSSLTHHPFPSLHGRAGLLAVKFFDDVAAEDWAEPAGVARHPGDQFGVQREDDDLPIASHATQHQFGGPLG